MRNGCDFLLLKRRQVLPYVWYRFSTGSNCTNFAREREKETTALFRKTKNRTHLLKYFKAILSCPVLE